MPATPPDRDRDEPPELVERGPVETLAPSRTAVVLVAVAGLVVAVLAGIGALNVEGNNLDDDETLLSGGRQELVAGPATIEAELPGDWVARERCGRWLQLSDAGNDATTLHVVWLDAVPLPSDAPSVDLVATPPDLPTWWRDELDLRVDAVGEQALDGRPVTRWDLAATDDARRRDGLVACGQVGGPAATGMFGPAARFDQQVAIVETGDTPLLMVAAGYVGGDVDRAVEALERVLETGTLEIDDGDVNVRGDEGTPAVHLSIRVG